jgi:hypothetical protein
MTFAGKVSSRSGGRAKTARKEVNGGSFARAALPAQLCLRCFARRGAERGGLAPEDAHFIDGGETEAARARKQEP